MDGYSYGGKNSIPKVNMEYSWWVQAGHALKETLSNGERPNYQRDGMLNKHKKRRESEITRINRLRN